MIDKKDVLTNQLNYEASTTWHHTMKALFDSGDAAKMGAPSFLIYSIIKAHVNYTSGEAFPGIELIGKQAGMSRHTVMRCLDTLEELGYLRVEKQGRKNTYYLREKVDVYQDGDKTAVASWDYVPGLMQAANKELKQFLLTGQHNGSIVFVEHLNLNVQINNGNENTQFNMNDIKDPELRAATQRLQDSRRKKHGAIEGEMTSKDE